MKVKYSLSIEEEDLNKLRHFSELTGYPIARLFEDHIRTLVQTYEGAGLGKKKRMSKLDAFRLLASGIRAEV